MNIKPKKGLFAENDRAQLAQAKSRRSDTEYHHSNNQSLAYLELKYTRGELRSYTDFRLAGISKASVPWIKKCSRTFWDVTKGTISKKSCDTLRKLLLEQYTDPYAQRKVLNFAKALLKYLAKTHFDARYQAFELFLDLPKARKMRKHVTDRIITVDDITAVINAIALSSDLDEHHRSNFEALVLFGAYTGQRPYATIRQLEAQQFHQILEMEKPVLHVRAEQDKIRMEHYVPLHPAVVKTIKACNPSRAGLQFAFESFRRWTKQAAIRLTRCASTFAPSDLQKFAEQHGDIIGWDQSNRAYIMTHGVSGVDWTHYKSILSRRACMTSTCGIGEMCGLSDLSSASAAPQSTPLLALHATTRVQTR